MFSIKNTFFNCQKRSKKKWKQRVFSSTNKNLTKKRLSTFNNNFIHKRPLIHGVYANSHQLNKLWHLSTHSLLTIKLAIVVDQALKELSLQHKDKVLYHLILCGVNLGHHPFL